MPDESSSSKVKIYARLDPKRCRSPHGCSHPASSMPCCEDGSCTMACPAYQVSAEDAAYAEALSRYPKVQPRKHDWAAAPNGAAQFEGYDDGLRPPADDDDDEAAEPFEYSGEHLQACNFPLGSFGTGRVLLCGDGTMKEWTVVNQVRTDDGGPGDAPQPLDDMPANFFAISATPAGGKAQTYALVTPQNYTPAVSVLAPASPLPLPLLCCGGN